MARTDRRAAVLEWAHLMQQRMGRLEPGLGAGWLLKHPVGKADHLHQPVQPLGGHQICRLEVQVLAQKRQPGAAPALLNRSQALLLV